jgi:hypothetical protein
MYLAYDTDLWEYGSFKYDTWWTVGFQKTRVIFDKLNDCYLLHKDCCTALVSDYSENVTELSFSQCRYLHILFDLRINMCRISVQVFWDEEESYLKMSVFWDVAPCSFMES